MTQQEVTVRLAAIISTLAETGGAPESAGYIACGMDMGAWEVVRGVLTGAKLVTISAHYMRPTQAGRDLAAKLDAVIANGLNVMR